jgi:hypothetical protein
LALKHLYSEGYAHALFRRTCPVPVDSGLERQTFESISTVAKWLKAKSGLLLQLTLEKPVFDIEVEIDGEKGFVLPDFMLNAEVGLVEAKLKHAAFITNYCFN